MPESLWYWLTVVELCRVYCCIVLWKYYTNQHIHSSRWCLLPRGYLLYYYEGIIIVRTRFLLINTVVYFQSSPDCTRSEYVYRGTLLLRVSTHSGITKYRKIVLVYIYLLISLTLFWRQHDIFLLCEKHLKSTRTERDTSIYYTINSIILIIDSAVLKNFGVKHLVRLIFYLL